MAVTAFQAEILKLLAAQRRASGESYVAGGVALNELLSAPRRSRDIDVFHDTLDALVRTAASDRAMLGAAGCAVAVLRESPSFVEALVTRGGERVLMQWARDSAFRFFPLVEDERLGLALHPFDLATNKVLAMAGRLEARDWIDALTCDANVQPFGYLVWAACGKDPGYNPRSLLAEISRAHYSQAELDALDFAGARPKAIELGERWHAILREARAVCDRLPPEQVGKCVVTRELDLERRTADELAPAVRAAQVRFHSGTVGGSWPTLRAP